MGFLCAFPRAEIGTIVIAIQIVIGHAGTLVTKRTTVATSTQEPGRHITTTQRSDPVDSRILLIGHSLIRAMLGVLRDI